MSVTARVVRTCSAPRSILGDVTMWWYVVTASSARQFWGEDVHIKKEFQRSRNHSTTPPILIEAHLYRSFLLPIHFKRWSDLVNSKGGRGVRRHRSHDDSYAREAGGVVCLSFLGLAHRSQPGLIASGRRNVYASAKVTTREIHISRAALSQTSPT
ncbi:uncharacterized protein LACBIDRAFT_303229 [Laccaria bicolor S238N-H82]|uniref:Predicted protein n=1 Tax=Laccaria bicolor (strain S238N-H82 / ATCC MYA-4686) TaxID=486041 RepID=B0DJ62_LACBS|nr:uncharacterized protein LACBIDRAFT_303229 [Laccaria bicolor S238N-H82]EDR05348.1 predicted protein [Laccaria bicolor S238N-H82]|eukprot:XP_001883906.1 predicted protein [Laccaria bicolor S238N-H82]